MRRVLRKLTGSVLLTTLLGTMIISNTQAANAQQPEAQIESVSLAEAHCLQLTPDQMATMYGSGWADWALRLIDVGCVSGSAAAVLKMTSPFVGAFCAGWAIGRYIGG